MRWSRSFADVAKAQLGPRRRAATRYPVQRHARAKAASWPQPLVVELGDVSTGGFAFVTGERVAMGERVDVELVLPTGAGFIIVGSVVSVTPGAQAGLAPDLTSVGVRLEQLDLTTIALYTQLLSEAQAGAPTPGDSVVMDQGKMSAALKVARRGGTPSQGTPSLRPGQATVGIDLGNRHASIAAVRNGVVNVLSRIDGVRSVPCIVAFPDATGAVVAGNRARPYLDSDPAHAVEAPKRLLGRRFSDPELAALAHGQAWRILQTREGGVALDMYGQPMSAARLAGGVLAELKAIAEEALGEPVQRAVLSVPVTWEEDALGAVRRAAELAGLEVIGLVDEPTAAALANAGMPQFGGKIGVADFGAVDFEFSVIDVTRGDYQVLASSGDTKLGGDDVDIAMAERIALGFHQSSGANLREMPAQWRRLVEACEKAKRELVFKDVATVSVKEVLETPKGAMDLYSPFDRTALISVLAPYIDRALHVITETLDTLQMQASELSAVFLTGGMSYMPITWQSLEVTLRVPILCGAPPELAVCLGTGLYAARL